MEYVVQAFKVLRNLADAETNARCPKTGFCAASLIQTQFFGVFRDPRELAILCFNLCKHLNMRKIN